MHSSESGAAGFVAATRRPGFRPATVIRIDYYPYTTRSRTMFGFTARMLGLSIVGLTLCAWVAEAGGEKKEKGVPAVTRDQISTLPTKILKERIPTLPAK